MKKRPHTPDTVLTNGSIGDPGPGPSSLVAQPAISLGRLLLASTVAGVAAALSFAPFFVFPLAWVGVAMLFVLWERSTPRRAMLAGLVFGFCFYGVGGYWMLSGLLRHGGYSVLVAIVAVAATITLIAAHVALAGLSRAAGGPGWRTVRLLVVMPGAFVIAEWWRSFTFTGFPWLSLGYGQIEGPLAGWAPVGGVHLVSVASAVIAGALAVAWFERSRWWVPAAALAALSAAGMGLGTIAWTQPEGRALAMAAIQGNVGSDIKWTPAHLQPTLNLYANDTLAAMRGRQLDAVVWPETAITARPDQVAPFLAGLRQAAQSGGATVVFGIIDVERGNVPQYFNAALAVGATEGVYRKRHLVPMTEFLPAFLPDSWREEKQQSAIAIFAPGDDSQVPLRIAEVAVGVTICYETAYGRRVRPQGDAPRLLMSLSNDDWFMGTSMPAMTHQVARMRALEGGRQMLRVANSGVTAWIDADGTTLAELPMRVRGTLQVRMQPRSGLTPYWRWGEWTWVAALLAMAAVAGIAGRLK
jgi:apolipoprotein N-acyltransferase